MKAARDVGRKASFDLDGNGASYSWKDDEVDFSSRRSSKVVAGNTVRYGIDDVLDCEALPTCPDDRMAKKLVVVVNSQKFMQKARVAKIDSRRASEALSDVPVPGYQAANQ